MNKFFPIFTLSLSIFLGLSQTSVFAQTQNSQILSVTPPLFQLSINPGDIWQSSVKVVNGNPYPLTVYAEVVNFSPLGEEGRGNFIPIDPNNPDDPTLAHWIQIANGPHTIPPEQTKDVSFFVEVPESASPGGHYAAILISTEVPKSTGSNRLAVQTSQAVTTLFFTRIEGDVNEAGLIREFRAVDRFLSTPEAELSLRFENKGNVHLQPRGDIVITNMWGTERGRIPINYQTHYGNVLPKSIRDFRFEWSSDFKITDVGRYKAEVALTYGSDGFKSTNATTYFWVVPVKTTLITLGVVAIFVFLIVTMIRAYIRRMLTLAGIDPHTRTRPVPEDEIEVPPSKQKTSVISPLASGVLDLRTQLSNVEESMSTMRTIAHFILAYKKFFISLVLLILIFVVSVLYIDHATEKNRAYTITVEESGSMVPVE